MNSVGLECFLVIFLSEHYLVYLCDQVVLVFFLDVNRLCREIDYIFKQDAIKFYE